MTANGMPDPEVYRAAREAVGKALLARRPWTGLTLTRWTEFVDEQTRVILAAIGDARLTHDAGQEERPAADQAADLVKLWWAILGLNQ